MARSFGNSRFNYLGRASSLISAANPRPISIGVSLKPNNTGIVQSIFTNNFGGSPLLYCSVSLSNSDDILRFYSGGWAANSDTFTIDTTRFNHLGWAWDTDDDLDYYVDGAAKGSTTRASGGTATDAAAIGSYDGATGTLDVDGDLAEFAVWNVILTVAEWAQLGIGVPAYHIRPANLVSYVPILGRHSPEPDWMDNATWAINGTLTVAPHCRVHFIMPTTWMIPAAAPVGRTTYNTDPRPLGIHPGISRRINVP